MTASGGKSPRGTSGSGAYGHVAHRGETRANAARGSGRGESGAYGSGTGPGRIRRPAVALARLACVTALAVGGLLVAEAVGLARR